MLTSPEILDGQTMTAEHYLDMEREGIREFQGKYELFNQKIRFMAGASQAHNTIAGNILTLLKMFIWQQNLSMYVNQSDMKVVSFLKIKTSFILTSFLSMANWSMTTIKKTFYLIQHSLLKSFLMKLKVLI